MNNAKPNYAHLILNAMLLLWSLGVMCDVFTNKPVDNDLIEALLLAVLAKQYEK